MNSMIRHSLLTAALLCSVATTYGQAPAPGASAPPATRTIKPITNFVPVTDEMLRSPKPEDWLLYRGNYQGWGYSPLDQINKSNAKNLQLVWSRVMEEGSNEITPIIHDGVMYLGNPGDVIQAIDAATGDLLWEYRHPLPPRDEFPIGLGQSKRSISLYGDRVIFATWDNIIVALDAKTGQRVWQSKRGGDLYVQNSTGPIVANGMAVAGSTCQNAGFGCYVTGHDARNGEELWRNELIPRPGQPGDETWGGAPFEKRWMTGIAWSFDAATGEFLWAKQTVEQNLVSRIDPKGLVTVNEDSVLKDVNRTYRICPTYTGGRDWPMGAYNPKVNVMFIPLFNACIDSKARTDRGTDPKYVYNTTNTLRFPAGKDKAGRIDAI